MSVGNYLPAKSTRLHGYRMVYVPSVHEATPRPLDVLVSRILTILPDSYTVVLEKTFQLY